MFKKKIAANFSKLQALGEADNQEKSEKAPLDEKTPPALLDEKVPDDKYRVTPKAESKFGRLKKLLKQEKEKEKPAKEKEQHQWTSLVKNLKKEKKKDRPPPKPKFGLGAIALQALQANNQTKKKEKKGRRLNLKFDVSAKKLELLAQLGDARELDMFGGDLGEIDDSQKMRQHTIMRN
eukprot:TRINITY_DN12126_c0_g1_i4.p2 TRINITY_DN12126_c0_g1~~TRINITY_DN12126_c0_g1_i4.p2  ORF type:complete len:179 (+),score=36.82 TRINITY_DN12126_c0_g1_i4:85-621(+)